MRGFLLFVLQYSLITSGFIALPSQPASAQHILPSPSAQQIFAAALTPKPRVYDWSGFYIGGHVGYGWGHDSSQSGRVGGSVDSSSTRNPKGAFGGLHAGYNFMLISKLLLGIEIDASAADIRGDSLAGNGNSALQTKINWVGTARGRIGYSFGNILLYGTGGYAWAAIEEFRTQLRFTTGAATPGTVEKASYTNNGWTIGGGAEIGISQRLSVKVEYLYLDFGSRLFTRSISGVFAQHNDYLHIGRIGLNYKF